MSNKPVIVVVTYNRPNSLQRLLTSIANANYTVTDITLIISIDKSESNATIEVAENFSWKFGTKKIINQSEHLGLKQHILNCGDLTHEYSTVIILEDDLLVSPYFYQYACESEYFYSSDKSIAGISLYNYQVAESCFYPFQAIDDGSDVYFMQVASSWGQLFTRQQWNGFKEWYNLNPNLGTEANIPEYLHQWGKHSWKKHYIHYLVATQKYFVFPRLSLSTNFEEEGTNSSTRSIFQVPVQLQQKKYTFRNLNESLAVYDAWFEPKPELFKSLEKFDFEVDLYGSKPLNNTKYSYILTSKRGSDSILGFSNELFPLANNILTDLKGSEISLFKKSDQKLSPAVLRQRNLLSEIKSEGFYNFSILLLVDKADSNLLDKTIRSLDTIEYTGLELFVFCKDAQKELFQELLSHLRFRYVIISYLPGNSSSVFDLSLINTGAVCCILKEGEVIKKNTLQKVNLIFQKFRHINWIRGVDDHFIKTNTYEQLDASAFRLIPNDILNQVNNGILNFSLGQHFFRKSDEMNTISNELALFIYQIKKHQLHVVLDVFVEDANPIQQIVLKEDEKKLLLEQFTSFIQKRSFGVKWLDFLIKSPFFGDKTVKKWFLFAAENYPHVIRYDKATDQYHLNSF